MVENCCGTLHSWIRNHMSARIVIQSQYTVAILLPPSTILHQQLECRKNDIVNNTGHVDAISIMIFLINLYVIFTVLLIF